MGNLVLVAEHALQTAARARGIAHIASVTGLGRESLYKALAPGAQPRFATVCKVLKALGVPLSIVPAKTRALEASRSRARAAVAKRPVANAGTKATMAKKRIR